MDSVDTIQQRYEEELFKVPANVQENGNARKTYSFLDSNTFICVGI